MDGDRDNTSVTLTATFDTFEAIIGDRVVDDAAADSERCEPKLAALPLFVEFGEPARLDPERAGLIWEVRTAAQWAIQLRSPLVSLAFHLLPLLIVLLLPLIMTEPPAPIPVQLVFEPPPPPPPPPPPQPQPQPPQPEPKMETGRLASVDMGVVKPDMDLGRAADPVPQPAAGAPQQTPTETQTAATTTPPPPPLPMPKPVPPKEHHSAIQLPKPSGANVPHHEEVPREAQHSAHYPGTAATRDEYFAYLVTLTQRHIDVLPQALAHQRHGETALSIQVQSNGSVLGITVVQSCGDAELDQRVVAMVRAVGRFPPLPQWFQGEAMDMVFRVNFPLMLQ